MILRWMVYGAAVALLFGLAAHVLERVARPRGGAVRWLWTGSLAASLLVPAASALLAALPPTRHAIIPQPTGAMADGEPSIVWRMDPAVVVPRWSEGLDGWLLAGWLGASGVALLALAGSSLALRRRMRGWSRRTVDGMDVWIAPDAGPAVAGFLRGRIVLPGWMLERGEAERALVLAHEAEHLRAGDPRLVLGALLVAAAFPWNPALWWQCRRLRHAVEVDCDARVLRRGADARAYGRMLLDVMERGGTHRLAVAALGESPSSLEQRIRIMLASPSKPGRRRATMSVALASALVLTACLANQPDRLGRESSAAESVDARIEMWPADGGNGSPPIPADGAERIHEIVRQSYPAALRTARIGGTTVAEFVVLPAGTVDPASVRIIGARLPGETLRPELADATLAALQQIRFVPGTHAIATRLTITWMPT